jgi:hypothetical protein
MRWSGSEEVGLDETDRKTQLFLIYRVSGILKFWFTTSGLKSRASYLSKCTTRCFNCTNPKCAKVLTIKSILQLLQL